MRVDSVKIKNYRTIEDIELTFPGFYHALSGSNDSGKSNIIRAIGHVIGHADPFDVTDRQQLRIATDFPKWLTGKKDAEINISVILEIESQSDASLYNFLQEYLKIKAPESKLLVTITVTLSKDRPSGEYSVCILDVEYDGDKAQEVVRRIQSAPAMYFHNSTDHDSSYGLRRFYHGVMGENAFRDNQIVRDLNATIQTKMRKIAKAHQEKLSQIFARLEPKYKVSLAMPDIEMSNIPYTINLENSKMDVPLDDWGAGTRNKAQILVALFNALASKRLDTTSSRVAPIVVIEEPESFLHPSAQGQFGRLLQDLAEELHIQIIVATHSPYMLSHQNPNSNILVTRAKLRGLLRQTQQKPTVGDGWMRPFGEALGVDSEEFRPWKEALFSGSDSILMVEGSIDKEYFELLRDPRHAHDKLEFDGLIFPYEGCDNLKNQVVLKLMSAKFSTALITFDLDAKEKLQETLHRVGLREGIHYFTVGVNTAGRKNIEGLVPSHIHEAVYGANGELVQKMANGSSDEKKAARAAIKKLILDKFKEVASPRDASYSEFYQLTKKLNSALKKAKQKARSV